MMAKKQNPLSRVPQRSWTTCHRQQPDARTMTAMPRSLICPSEGPRRDDARPHASQRRRVPRRRRPSCRRRNRLCPCICQRVLPLPPSPSFPLLQHPGRTALTQHRHRDLWVRAKKLGQSLSWRLKDTWPNALKRNHVTPTASLSLHKQFRLKEAFDAKCGIRWRWRGIHSGGSKIVVAQCRSKDASHTWPARPNARSRAQLGGERGRDTNQAGKWANPAGSRTFQASRSWSRGISFLGL